jgi:hypothetical protein
MKIVPNLIFAILISCRTLMSEEANPIFVNSSTPRVFVVDDSDSSMGFYVMAPEMQSLTFTNIMEQRRLVSTFWDEKKDLFRISSVRLVGLSDRIKVADVGLSSTYSTGRVFIGVLGRDRLAPGKYEVINRLSVEADIAMSDAEASPRNIFTVGDQGYLQDIKADFPVVLDFYNEAGIGVPSKIYEELEKNELMGCDLTSSKNARKRRFMSSFAIGELQFQSVVITKLEIPVYVLGVDALRQHPLMLELIEGDDLQDSVLKLHIGRNIEEAYVNERLFHGLLTLMVQTKNSFRKFGHLVREIHPLHPLAPFLQEGDLVEEVDGKRTDDLYTNDVSTLLLRCILKGGQLQIRRKGGITENVSVSRNPKALEELAIRLNTCSE